MFRTADLNGARVLCAVMLCALFATAHAQFDLVASDAAETRPVSGQAYDIAGPTLEVRYRGGVDWPFVALKLAASPDWAKATTLEIPVANSGDQAVELFLRLGDDEKASWPDHAVAGSVRIAAHTGTTVLLALQAQDSRPFGMHAEPPPAGVPADVMPRLVSPVARSTGRVAADHVQRLFLVVWGQNAAHTLIFGTPRPATYDWGRAAYAGLIDRYGQSTRAQWPGKVASDDQLKAEAASEAQQLAHWLAQAPETDRYGGSLSSTTRTSGFFRTERDATGKWSFITPDGHRFFSLGVNAVGTGDGATYVQGREFMFAGLPQDGDVLIHHYGSADSHTGLLAQQGRTFDRGRWFNFYTANLQRKFAATSYSELPQRMARRLAAWGFNTVGNWSDARLQRQPALPYVQAISIPGDFAVLKSSNDYWGALPDAFDPRFAAAAEVSIAAVADAHRDDPWLLGYFVDNELAWGNGGSPDARVRYAAAVNALTQGSASPAQRAFVSLLRARYPTPAAFTEAWGVPLARWEDLDRPGLSLPDTLGATALRDLSDFTRQLADVYFRTVQETLKRHDPHHLYLGSRFAAQTDEAVGACNQWCDVVSFNMYAGDFAAARQARFRELTKPALISEFNFSSGDRGPFWRGLVDVGTEAQRGPAYASFVAAAAADPAIVGVHWFQYLDEPATGRLWDGENAHFGLVSVTDTPYAEFIEAVRRANWAARQ